MQAFGHFQLTHRSAVRTRLRAPVGCHSAALAAVRRRLVACDGIMAVEADPAAGSLVISHSPAFSWSSIGAAAWRLADTGSGAHADKSPACAGRPRAQAPAPLQPPGATLQDLVSLALESVLARRPAEQILRDVALGVLAIALREARRP